MMVLVKYDTGWLGRDDKVVRDKSEAIAIPLEVATRNYFFSLLRRKTRLVYVWPEG